MILAGILTLGGEKREGNTPPNVQVLTVKIRVFFVTLIGRLMLNIPPNIWAVKYHT